MKNLWEVWKLNKSDLLLTLGSMLAAIFFGFILTAVIMLLADDVDSYAVMGSFMALVIWLGMIVFAGAFTLEKRFSMAVGLGETRKSFIIKQLTIIAVNTLLEILFLIVMNAVEKGIGAVLYKVPCEFDVVSMLIDVRIILAAVVIVPVLTMFCGMLLIKFQMKAFWGIWVFWMLGSFGMSRVGSWLHKNPDSALAKVVNDMVEWFSVLGITGVALGGILIAVVLLVITVAALRKQPVTQF